MFPAPRNAMAHLRQAPRRHQIQFAKQSCSSPEKSLNEQWDSGLLIQLTYYSPTYTTSWAVTCLRPMRCLRGLTGQCSQPVAQACGEGSRYTITEQSRSRTGIPTMCVQPIRPWPHTNPQNLVGSWRWMWHTRLRSALSRDCIRHLHEGDNRRFLTVEGVTGSG
jgi:hypothetical protein